MLWSIDRTDKKKSVDEFNVLSHFEAAKGEV